MKEEKKNRKYFSVTGEEQASTLLSLVKAIFGVNTKIVYISSPPFLA